MIEAKMHKEGVLSLCDKELLGKILSDENMELKISETFYKGDDYKKEMIEELAKNARNINAVGKESVDLLVKLGIVDKDSVRYVNKIPFAFVFEA